MSKRKSRRVVVVSDFHCGHRAGLTPPQWQSQSDGLQAARSAYWDYYATQISRLRPIDVLIVNGDAIDGRGERSGATELITADRHEQARMAAEAILYARAAHIVMTYGTPYHTGAEEDLEDYIAEMVRADKIGGHEWIEVGGVVFDVKHKVGSSSTPHGRKTAIEREKLWNLIWAERERQPKGDIIIRSHVHYFGFSGDQDYLAMTTPALQGHGSKFGSRQCSGTVDFGFIYFDIDDKGGYTWAPVIASLPAQKTKALAL